METFINCVRVARKNKGLLYWYDNTGYVYSPCRDLYGEPVMNFREKDRNGKEKYGKELSNADRILIYKKRLKTKT